MFIPMFHVEHMRKSLFLIILSAALLFGCEKPNPHPESMDPILADIESELKGAEAAQSSTEKELEGFLLEEKKVQPQTGQIKYAQKRVYETQAKLDKIKQMVLYWQMRRDSRIKEARAAYMAAYKKKEPWPDPKEFKEYSMQKKLREAPLSWSVRRRIEEAGLGIPIKAPGSADANSGSGGGHSEPAPAAESEGH